VGGQALARYLLDNPAMVAQRNVVDVATGCGLVAIAAARAGARSVLAVDTDPVAVAAARINAIANGANVDVELRNFRGLDPPRDSVVTVGDCFYERALAQALLAWLAAARDRGSTVLIGDPGRTYLPRESLHRLADYLVPVSREIEDDDEKTGSVWRLPP
jgi:predicted nicotinamide N-methyase